MIVAQMYVSHPSHDGRARLRKVRRLEVQAIARSGGSNAVVRDLSDSGFCLDVDAELNVGDKFDVHFCTGGKYTAKVIWVDGQLRGCEFLKFVPNSIVSAACFMSAFEKTADRHDESTGHVVKIREENTPPTKHKLWYISTITVMLLLLLGVIFLVKLMQFVLK